MPLILLTLFIAVPIIEIGIFIEIGGIIGLWPTLGTIVLTAIVGSFLIRQQGLAMLGQAQESIAAGRLPVREIFDGVCLLVAGAFLLTPGFLTDSLGAFLLIPVARHLIRTIVLTHFLDRDRVWRKGGAPRTQHPPRDDGSHTIEGEYTISSPDDEGARRPREGSIGHDESDGSPPRKS